MTRYKLCICIQYALGIYTSLLYVHKCPTLDKVSSVGLIYNLKIRLCGLYGQAMLMHVANSAYTNERRASLACALCSYKVPLDCVQCLPHCIGGRIYQTANAPLSIDENISSVQLLLWLTPVYVYSPLRIVTATAAMAYDRPLRKQSWSLKFISFAAS